MHTPQRAAPPLAKRHAGDPVSHYLGVDLAWGEGNLGRRAKETGMVCLSADGTVLDAGWARGIDEVARWILSTARGSDVVAIDAPLVVTNATGMRECEKQVGRGYGRWKVSANASNRQLPWLGGVTLAGRLEQAGFHYDDGLRSAPAGVPRYFECYPYATIVGLPELGYDSERPRYKRPVRTLSPALRRAFRASACDDLVQRLSALIRFETHPATAELLAPSPTEDAPYKHREDLLDAAIAALTATLWDRHGTARFQVLGADDVPEADGRRATIIAPARPEQRVADRASTARLSS